MGRLMGRLNFFASGFSGYGVVFAVIQSDFVWGGVLALLSILNFLVGVALDG